MNGLRDKRQYAAADIPHCGSGVIQRGFCVKVREIFKRQSVVIVQPLFQYQSFAYQIAHAVYYGIGEPFAQTVAVKVFKETAGYVFFEAVKIIAAAVADVFLHSPFQVFRLIVRGAGNSEAALQLTGHRVHIPFRQRPLSRYTPVFTVSVGYVKHIADFHIAVGIA
ncbi:MAG: hypothetical protein LBD92_00520 [Oscillospiraceae bacterium]|nr:hypothetical protein [Oscillospiraceae bacterium]